MSDLRSLWVLLVFLCCGAVLAQDAGGPLTVTGRLYQPNPPSPGHADYTARGMLVLDNKSGSALKDVKVEANYIAPDGKVLFTDTQTVKAAKAKAQTEVYFFWVNPTNTKIDHVDAVISGKADQPFQTKVTLRYDY